MQEPHLPNIRRAATHIDAPGGTLVSKAELQARIASGKQAVLLVNTHSRRGAALYEAASERLAARGFDLLGSFPVEDPRRLVDTIHEAVALDAPLLIVGGGDGTVSDVAGHLAYRNTALGVLPLGTTNNFARNMGLPFELEAAIDVLTSGKVADIDLGQIGDHYFGNVASIGLTVEVARNVSGSLKHRIGRFAYVVAGAQQLMRHQPFKVTISTEDARHDFHTHQLIIANGGFHGGRRIADDASVEDRELTIFPIGDYRRASAVSSLLSFEYGRARSVEEGHFISTSEAMIVTEPDRDIEIDGEILSRTPVRVAVACEALRVMVPTDFEDV
jgi:YegS/Rv2252/BmrU family lipid kinase